MDTPREKRKRIFYRREYENNRKLPQLDFLYDPAQVRLEYEDFKMYLVTPKVPGISIADFIFQYIILENGVRTYKKIGFGKWYHILDSVVRFAVQIEEFHKYFSHNDINTGNLIYDENFSRVVNGNVIYRGKIYLIDFESLKDISVVSKEKDLKDLESIIKELIELGQNNPEIREFCQETEMIDSHGINIDKILYVF